MTHEPTLLRTDIPDHPVKRGKVRDVYDLGDRLAVVATDRISAFDWVLPDGIPGKGRVLTELTLFWLGRLGVPNHLLGAGKADLPDEFRPFEGRTMIVRKAEVVPFECVVRGYLAGSGWKDYRRTGAVCGVALPAGLRQAERLPEPVFTPATKAETGHDENVDFEDMAASVGEELAGQLRERSLEIYRRAADHTDRCGLILADTKFEWGRLPDGTVILIDEVLTPDSSRFWPKDGYEVGTSPPSFDKQFVRDWLETTDWDKSSPPPNLPAEVVEKTASKYREALERLSGIDLPGAG